VGCHNDAAGKETVTNGGSELPQSGSSKTGVLTLSPIRIDFRGRKKYTIIAIKIAADF